MKIRVTTKKQYCHLPTLKSAHGPDDEEEDPLRQGKLLPSSETTPLNNKWWTGTTSLAPLRSIKNTFVFKMRVKERCDVERQSLMHID